MKRAWPETQLQLGYRDGLMSGLAGVGAGLWRQEKEPMFMMGLSSDKAGEIVKLTSTPFKL